MKIKSFKELSDELEGYFNGFYEFEYNQFNPIMYVFSHLDSYPLEYLLNHKELKKYNFYW